MEYSDVQVAWQALCTLPITEYSLQYDSISILVSNGKGYIFRNLILSHMQTKIQQIWTPTFWAFISQKSLSFSHNNNKNGKEYNTEQCILDYHDMQKALRYANTVWNTMKESLQPVDDLLKIGIMII